MNPGTEQLNYDVETPQIPYNYDVDGRFYLPISNQIYQKAYSQYTYHPPTFLLMPQQPIYQPCPQVKKQKKKKVNNKEVEALRTRIMELEMRQPEVKIVKEVVTDSDQITKLEKELRMVKMQLDHEHENNAQKDRTISDLRAQIQKNDLSRSTSLVSLQTTLVERERQITKQDGIISQLQAEINLLRGELDDAHHHIDEQQTTHEEVTVEKMTYLSKQKLGNKNSLFSIETIMRLKKNSCLLKLNQNQLRREKLKEVKQIVVERKDNIGRINKFWLERVDFYRLFNDENKQQHIIYKIEQKIQLIEIKQKGMQRIDAPILFNFLDRRFEIIKVFGNGGEGPVYRCKCINWGINDQKQFALRCQRFCKDDEIQFIDNLIVYQNQYENEICQGQQNYQSSGLIRIYERFQTNNQYYILMELGELDLYTYLEQQQQTLTIESKIKIMIQITQSISYLHSKNLIHRDIKPENFIKISDQFKLIDFGLTRKMRGDQYIKSRNTLVLIP
ncbi:unnamed protein product [Paramecium octaurelia]|uniref:Protein kinase domain-containing protein n=1 Tax=Paramecium octaurelia TaxID=43137 RepID=A0A8S1VMS4_PAROT|nr:unnamed protein product [Paramecium octaurelia]